MSDNALTVDEKIRLSHLENRVEQGLRTFVEAGNALAEIRDQRLYRESFESFEEYCRARWKISRPRAYEIIGSAEVVTILSGLPDIQRLPANSRQAEPLAQLPPDQIPSAWAEAVETAPNGRLTGAHVDRVVNRTLGKPPKVKPLEPGNLAIVTAINSEDFGQTVRVSTVEKGGIITVRKPTGAEALFLPGELQIVTAEQQVEQLQGLLREVLAAAQDLPAALIARIEAAIA